MDTTAAAMPSSAVDAASSLLEVPEKPPLDTVILKQEDMHSLMQVRSRLPLTLSLTSFAQLFCLDRRLFFPSPRPSYSGPKQ